MPFLHNVLTCKRWSEAGRTSTVAAPDSGIQWTVARWARRSKTDTQKQQAGPPRRMVTNLKSNYLIKASLRRLCLRYLSHYIWRQNVTEMLQMCEIGMKSWVFFLTAKWAEVDFFCKIHWIARNRIRFEAFHRPLGWRQLLEDLR